MSVFLVFAGLLPVALDDGLRLMPAEIRLSVAGETHRLLLQEQANGPGSQVVDGVEWSIDRPGVATVEGGVVRPIGDGEATITANAGGRSATARVVVSLPETPRPTSFRDDVEPILARLNCNAGACHGALAGKGGFRLSLRGYDPAADFFQVVKQDGGRRVELAEPARSLLLAKPTGAVPHKGGTLIDVASEDYAIIADWIAAGAAPPRDDDPVVDAIRVWPPESRHCVGDRQDLVVQSIGVDGRVRDVTRFAKWSSTNEAVARVDDNGRVTTVGPGEGAIVAWFASRLTIARVTVPYNDGTSSVAVAGADRRPPRNVLDERIDSQLARLNLPASPACNDAEFLRRATITTIGRMPTADEARAFLADRSGAKRNALADDLLRRPEFVDYWTYKWSDVLMLNGTLLRPPAVKAYYQAIRKNVADNTPWDRFVRAVVTSTGESIDNGLTNFYAVSQSPEEMVENASQAFLGLSIGCAKCHNHPLEKWTNDQYYAAANLFARVRAKGWGGEPRNGDGLRTLYVATSGDLVQPRTGKPQAPTPLDGTPLAFDDPDDRREHFADWLVSPENPYFARSIANRVWANFFNVGLVEGVDDMRVSNPSSNDDLLAAAAGLVVDAKFDLKPLMAAILKSNAFSRSSSPLAGNKADTRSYSRYYPRRMMAEVLHDAVVQVTSVPTKFEFVEFAGKERQKTEFYPEGTRAIQLYDAAVQNDFLRTFGRNPRRIVCECERSDQPSMVQVLHIANGDTLNEKLKDSRSRVGTLLNLRAAGMADAALIDEAYLLCLARFPTADERASLVALMPRPGDPEERATLEDVFWGLMSSREFLFNH